MERKAVFVCAAVGGLGLLAAVLAFVAEATKLKASDVVVTPEECTYPKSPALSLGLISAITLSLAQAIINTVTGCLCCKRNSISSDSQWRLAVTSFTISWVSFVIGFFMLLFGAVLNEGRVQDRLSYMGYYCLVVKPGVFCGAGVLSLASTLFAIVCYLAISGAPKNRNNLPSHQQYPTNQVIQMGQPVIPPRSDEPVFVHEDTYNRSQLLL